MRACVRARRVCVCARVCVHAYISNKVTVFENKNTCVNLLNAFILHRLSLVNNN